MKTCKNDAEKKKMKYRGYSDMKGLKDSEFINQST